MNRLPQQKQEEMKRDSRLFVRRPASIAAVMLLAAFVIIWSAPARAQTAVPTFECIGLYWKPGDTGGGEAKVRFRPQNDSAWREGYPLWYAERDGEFRGSLVGLQPGTTYEIELTAPSGRKASLTATTRPSNPRER